MQPFRQTGPRQDQVLHYVPQVVHHTSMIPRLVIYKYYYNPWDAGICPPTSCMDCLGPTAWYRKRGKLCKTCQDVDILTIPQLLMWGSSSKWHPSINCFGFRRCRLLNPEPFALPGQWEKQSQQRQGFQRPELLVRCRV